MHKLYVEIDFFPGIQFRNQNTKRLGDFEINRLPSTGCQELYSFCKQFAIRMLKMILDNFFQTGIRFLLKVQCFYTESHRGVM